MGSAAIQGELWSQRGSDWAEAQEAVFRPAYEAVLAATKAGRGMVVLDVGCGAGLFCEMARNTGARVSGIDAAAGLLSIAKARCPSADLRHGEMEELPFPDDSFDIVTGFNSFQYASSPVAALAEAKRVARKGGYVVAMVWGRPETCEAAGHLKAIGTLLPPPPPGAPGPFALSVDGALDKLMREAGLAPEGTFDVDAPWAYADLESALRGMLSAGPAIRAIRHSGEPQVAEAVAAAIKPYRTEPGGYLLRNQYRYVVARS
jgi:SAM-dependent methyltransferase